MKNVVNRALVAEKKYYNCPATEVITVSVAYSLCQAVSQTITPGTGSAIPDDGR